MGAPTPTEPAASIPAVRLRCTNSADETTRSNTHDVHLVDFNGDQLAPDEDDTNFHLVCGKALPRFAKRFVDIGGDQTADVGFTAYALHETRPTDGDAAQGARDRWQRGRTRR